MISGGNRTFSATKSIIDFSNLPSRLSSRRDRRSAHAWPGFSLGLGVLQLCDTTVDHRPLRLRQIRYGVDVTPYDWAWNIAGPVLLLISVIPAPRAAGRTRGRDGVVTLAHVRPRPGPATGPGTGRLLTVVAALPVAVACLQAAGPPCRPPAPGPRCSPGACTHCRRPALTSPLPT